MKLPFLLHKNNSSNSSLSSTSSSSSWPWPSCHQNPKTISFRATFTFTNPIHEENNLHYSSPPSSPMDSSPEITDSIENVIANLKSSKRLIFQRQGDSNSILEQEQEQNQDQEFNKNKNQEQEKEEEEEGLFMLMSMESRNPFYDFKKSMEEMVEAHALHQDWRSLEKLLYNFLKVNNKSSHGYIFAAFVDLLVNLASLHDDEDTKENDLKHGVSLSRAAVTAGEASTSSSCEQRRSVGESPLSPLSFYTSSSSYSSSSDETSSTFVPFMALLEMDQEKKKKKSLDHSFVS